MDQHFGYADSSLGQLHYVEAGEGDPIVLLPGAGRAWRMYRNLIPLLAPSRRVLVVDPPGFGASVVPAPGLSIPQLAETVVEAIDELGVDRFDLFGLNGGNKLGSWIAAAHPERVVRYIHAGFTHSIVLSNETRNHAIGSHPEVIRLLANDSGSAFVEDWVEQLRRAAAVDPEGDPLDVVAVILDQVSCAPYRRAFYRAVAVYDMEAAMRAIQCDALALELASPSEDSAFGRQAEIIAQELGWQAEVIEIGDHESGFLEDRAPELAEHILRYVGAPIPR